MKRIESLVALAMESRLLRELLTNRNVLIEKKRKEKKKILEDLVSQFYQEKLWISLDFIFVFLEARLFIIMTSTLVIHLLITISGKA